MVQFRTWSKLHGLPLLLNTVNSGTCRLQEVGACLFCKQFHQLYALLPIETVRNIVYFQKSSALQDVRSCIEKITESVSSVMCMSYRLFQQIYLEKPGSPLQHSSDCGSANFYWIRLLIFHRCRYHVHNFRYGTFSKSKFLIR